MMTQNVLAQLRHTLGTLGRWNGSLYLIDQVLQRVSGSRLRLLKYYLMAQPVAAQPLCPPRRGANIVIREILPGDAALGGMPRPQQVLAHRFENGAVCLGAFINDALAGFQWLQLGDYEEDEVRSAFRLEPKGKVAWDYDIYVDPAQRLGFVFLKLWDAANALLRSRGYEWSASRISAYAQASLASHRRLGAREIGKVSYLCLGRIQFGLLRGASTKLFASWRRNPAIPVVVSMGKS